MECREKDIGLFLYVLYFLLLFYRHFSPSSYSKIMVRPFVHIWTLFCSLNVVVYFLMLLKNQIKKYLINM